MTIDRKTGKMVLLVGKPTLAAMRGDLAEELAKRDDEVVTTREDIARAQPGHDYLDDIVHGVTHPEAQQRIEEMPDRVTGNRKRPRRRKLKGRNRRKW